MYLDENGSRIDISELQNDPSFNLGNILSYIPRRVSFVCKALKLDQFVEAGVSEKLTEVIDSYKHICMKNVNFDNLRFVYCQAEKQLVNTLELFSDSFAITQYKRMYHTVNAFLEDSVFDDNIGIFGRQEINEQVMHEYCRYLITYPMRFEKAAICTLRHLAKIYDEKRQILVK